MRLGGWMQPDHRAPLPGSVLPVVIFAVVVMVAVHVGLLVTMDPGFLQGHLADPDAYMRVVRVLELRQGAAWFDTVTPALAAPEGLSLHWTRPLDILILLPALALEHLAGLDPRQAIFVAGGLVSPPLHLAATLAAAWGAAGMWDRQRAPLYAVLMMAASPAAANYSAAGRADHHALILFAVTLGLAAAIHALRPGARGRVAMVAGAAFGFGVWVGPEALIIALPVLLAIGLAALVAEDGRHAATQGMRATAGMAAMVAVAIVVERPPGEWLAVETDRVSVEHLALALLCGSAFAALRPVAAGPRGRRWLVGIAAGAAALGAFVALFPVLPQRVAEDADAAIARMLRLHHDLIAEMQPLPPFGPGGLATIGFLMGGVPLLGLVAVALAMGGWRRDGGWQAGLVLGVALLAGIAAAFAAVRFALDLAAPAAIAAAGLMGQVFARSWPRAPALRLVLGLALVLGGLALPSLARDRAEVERVAEASGTEAIGSACDATALAVWLAEARPRIAPPGHAPILVMEDMNAAPEIAWRSGVRGVSGPYHRGGDAFIDVLRAFTATDDGAARAILRRRQADLVAVCASDPPTGNAADLVTRLRRGDAPAWLRPIPLPDALGGYRLFAVDPGA